MRVALAIHHDRAKTRAEAILNEYGITEPHEIDLESIAFARNVILEVGVLSGSEARLVRLRDRGKIRVSNSVVDPGRRRFGIAHELGHWELHRGKTQWRICSSQEMDPGYSRDEKELESNLFAAELLMPERMFLQKCMGDLSLQLIASLAEQFRTSLTATAIRTVLLRRDCAAVISSEEGRVKWCWGSGSFGQWVSAGEDLSPLSLAGRYFRGQTLPVEPRQVRSHAWLGEDYCGPHEIMEHSLAMPSYGAVLTLLCIP